MSTAQRARLVLAVSPSVYGFGFALFEGARSPIDWGVRYIKSRAHRENLTKVRSLMNWYDPDVLVIEDEKRSFRRSQRIHLLLRDIARLGARDGIEICRLSRRDVAECFGRFGGVKKRDIALTIVQALPDLKGSLPPRRRPWQPEHPRERLFEAVALALTYFYSTAPSKE